MTRYIKANCPLCHERDSLTVRFVDKSTDDGTPTSGIDYVCHACPCAYDDLMSGPFDETVETIMQWDRDCYPYAIKGEWSAL